MSSHVKALCGMAAVWINHPAPAPAAGSRFRPHVQQSIRISLGEAGIARLVEEYRNGAEAKELAKRYGFGLTTIKRLLGEQGIRKRVR